MVGRLPGGAQAHEIERGLAELFDRRAALDGIATARRWYWRQVAGFLLRAWSIRFAARRGPRLDSLLLDLGQALRSVRRDVGFTVLVTLTLALGVAGTTVFFSLVDHAVLRPLPYRDPGRLVAVEEFQFERGVTPPGEPGRRVSYPNMAELREVLDVFDGLVAIGSSSFFLHGANEPLSVRAGVVEPQLFDLLGIPPTLGSPLRHTDARQTVLSHGLWRDHFGSAANIVGTTISLDDMPYEVAGVMPPEFLAEQSNRLWVPLNLETQDLMTERGIRLFGAVGRLAAGVTLEEARAAARVAGERLAAAHPDTNEGWGVWMVSLHEAVVGGSASTLWRLFGASALLLFIACLNVANLQLARFTQRQRDVAIRAALGARLTRLLRLTVLENLFLGLVGAAAGAAVATLVLRLFMALEPSGNSRLAGAAVDGRSLVFAVVIASLASLAAGVLPLSALRSAALPETLCRGVRGAAGHPGGRRIRDLLLVGQIALTAVLLGGATLVSTSFLRLWTYDLGFEPDHVLTFNLTLNRDRYPDQPSQYRFYERLFDRLEARPGVEAVGSTSRLPLSGSDITRRLVSESDPEREAEVRDRPVSGDYFEVMRVPVLAGRVFTVGDQERVLVNVAAARELFPGVPVTAIIGRRVRFPQPLGPGAAPQPPWREIVGVVGDIRHQGLDPEPLPELYRPQWELVGGASYGGSTIVVRTTGPHPGLAESLREAVWAEDASEPVRAIRAMTEVVARSMSQPRFYAFLFSSFGMLALTFAVAGVFGVTAYLVSTRRREIGIRIALGAGPRSVARLVLGHGLILATGGLGIGLLAGAGLTHYVEAFLHGISATDVRIIGAAAALLLGAALAAMTVPCVRALRVDPVNVLRDE